MSRILELFTDSPNPHESRVRLTLNVSGRVDNALEEHAAKHGTDKESSLRYGLALLFAMDEAKSEGLHVGAFKELPDGSRVEQEFVFLR